MDDTKKGKDRLIRELSEARELIEILRKQVVMSNEEEIAFAESDSGQKSFTQHDYLPTLVNLLHSLVYVKDLKSEFLFANDSCARFMGVTSCNELIGKTDLDFYPPDIFHDLIFAGSFFRKKRNYATNFSATEGGKKNLRRIV